jgi:hypothetical protein
MLGAAGGFFSIYRKATAAQKRDSERREREKETR